MGCFDSEGLSCFGIEFREVGAGGETQSFPSAVSNRHDFRDEVIDGEGTGKDTEECRGRGQSLEQFPRGAQQRAELAPQRRGELWLAQNRSADLLPGVLGP